MLKRGNGWEVVEDVKSPCGASACLFRKRVVNNTAYRFVSWTKDSEQTVKYPYSTDEAFNLLEEWEVMHGILPSNYNPKAGAQ